MKDTVSQVDEMTEKELKLQVIADAMLIASLQAKLLNYRKILENAVPSLKNY